jgi:L-fuconolactonase
MLSDERMSNSVEFRGNMPRSLQELDTWTRQRQEEPLEPDLPIIDPHHHICDDERGRYLIEELRDEIASGHNIVSTVYVQYKTAYRTTGPVSMQPVGEVEYVTRIAEQNAGSDSGTRLCEGIVGHADLLLGDEVQEVLDALVVAGQGRLKGIRYGATWDDGAAGYGRSFAPRHLLLNPDFRKGFSRLAPLGLSFDAWVFYHQLPDLIDLLRVFPDTQVVLDHCGGILGIEPHVNSDAVYSTWRTHLQQLAEFPNVTVKVGGLGMLYRGGDFHTRALPPTSADLAQAWRPYVEACIEVFGPQRCMFESNFPVDKQSCSYGALWNAFKLIVQSYSPAEKAALFHDTALRVYRLG